MIDTFSVNLMEREDASADPNTMTDFWLKNPEAWQASRVGAISPRTAMMRFAKWLNDLDARPIFVGYPATYDFMWIYDYFFRYLGKCPFGFSGLDIKSVVSAVMDVPFHKVGKRMMKPEWFDPSSKHTHVAVDDAIEQGRLWMNVLKEYQNN